MSRKISFLGKNIFKGGRDVSIVNQKGIKVLRQMKRLP